METMADKKLRLVREQFQQIKFKHEPCGWVFEPEGITLESEFDGGCIVKVFCVMCRQVAGTAIVAIQGVHP